MIDKDKIQVGDTVYIKGKVLYPEDNNGLITIETEATSTFKETSDYLYTEEDIAEKYKIKIKKYRKKYKNFKNKYIKLKMKYNSNKDLYKNIDPDYIANLEHSIKKLEEQLEIDKPINIRTLRY